MVNSSIFKQRNYLATIILITAWLLGNLWTFQWWLESFQYIAALNLIITGIAISSLVIWLVITKPFKFNFSNPKLNLVPILFILGGEIGAIVLKWSINIPQLTLLCFILGSYGILGLFIDRSTWQKGLCIAIIAACIIPFVTAFNSGLGFPVRVLTAHAVAQTLADFHLGTASSHDIIVMENGIAQVDLPCSGMKSLWTGTVFLLGATWLEKRQLGWKWLLVAIANLCFLIAVNILRVLILVVTIEVWQQQQIAEIIHLPLGIIGFAIASFLTWLLLQKVPHNSIKVSIIQNEQFKSSKLSLRWLLGLVIILGILGQFDPNEVHAATLKEINLSPAIITENIPLTEPEAQFFANPANPIVQKLRFHSNKLSGSMLMVQSDTWQAHHPPELCFLGNGFKVDKMDSQVINNAINARWLSLQNGKLSATYWFQSDRSTTDDFIDRIWEHMTQKHRAWVLVSILFDSAEKPDSQNIQQFTDSIYQAIGQNLNSK